MRSVVASMRRLFLRGPDNRGLAADEDGVALGPDCELIWRSGSGYRVAQPESVAVIDHILMGANAGGPRLPSLLNLIAEALATDQLARAQLLALQFPINEFDREQLRKLRSVALLLKAGFDRDEPRDEAGRWTESGASAAPSSLAPGVTPAAFHPPDLPGGFGEALDDAIYQGEYHDFLVEHLADITRKAGGTRIESVRLIGITGTAPSQTSSSSRSAGHSRSSWRSRRATIPLCRSIRRRCTRWRWLALTSPRTIPRL